MSTTTPPAPQAAGARRALRPSVRAASVWQSGLLGLCLALGPALRSARAETLLAHLTATACAEDLQYGASPVESLLPNDYLTTSAKNELHTQWRQVSDYTGDGSMEMRVEWTFGTSKTVAQRFDDAVFPGESVTWEVYLGANVWGSTPDVVRTGTWRYSSNSGITASTFDSSGFSFSGDDGCWGAALSNGGVVDGEGNSNDLGYGVCNNHAGDISVPAGCGGLRDAGVITTYLGIRTYIYVNPASLTLAPTMQPTQAPSEAPSMSPTMSPTAFPTISPAPTDAPSGQPTMAPSVSPAPTSPPTPHPSPAPSPFPTGLPTIAPTPYPTPSPSMSPTDAPSLAPSISPFPSASPTNAPSSAPTLSLAPTDTPALAQFARLSGSACAEALPFGPGAVGSTAYLSTANADTPHTQWTQLMDKTDDGTPEMRIVWTFDTSDTLRQRFADAVASGISVTWTVFLDGNVWGSAPDVTRSGTWRFSNSAGISAITFGGSGSGFSNDDGCWGPPTSAGGTVDGNGGGNVGYGVCNYNSGDVTCSMYYENAASTAYSGLSVEMYFDVGLSFFPTTAPSLAPTLFPSTASPTLFPSTPAPSPALPTLAPSSGFFFRHSQFARLSGSACAESLQYGPGAVGSITPFLSTDDADTEHTQWTQLMDKTDDGTPEMRIVWTFDTADTLRQRFADAVASGISVTWTVFLDGNVWGSIPDVTRSGTWRFSNSAGITSATFSGSGLGLSRDDGCWGPPTSEGGTVDGDGGGNVGYGVCNYDSIDSDCNLYYENSVYTRHLGLSVEMYVRLSNDDDHTGDDDGSGSDLSGGEVAGVVLAVLGFVGIAAVVVFVYARRYQRQHHAQRRGAGGATVTVSTPGRAAAGCATTNTANTTLNPTPTRSPAAAAARPSAGTNPAMVMNNIPTAAVPVARTFAVATMASARTLSATPHAAVAVVDRSPVASVSHVSSPPMAAVSPSAPMIPSSGLFRMGARPAAGAEDAPPSYEMAMATGHRVGASPTAWTPPSASASLSTSFQPPSPARAPPSYAASTPMSSVHSTGSTSGVAMLAGPRSPATSQAALASQQQQARARFMEEEDDSGDEGVDTKACDSDGEENV